MRQLGLKRKAVVVTSMLATLWSTNSRCEAKAAPYDPYNDPEVESNWMVDRERQMLLGKQAYFEKLKNLRLALEERIRGSHESDPDVALSASQKLLPVYLALGLKKEANALAGQLEANNFEECQYLLETFYQTCDNKRQLVEVYTRSYELSKEKKHPLDPCSELDRIGDLYYQLGQMDLAEAKYKEASDFALNSALPPQAKKGGPTLVCIGALNSYACFLADRGRMREASVLMRQLMRFLEEPAKYDFSVGYGGDYKFGTFLELVRRKNPKLFAEFYQRWKLTDAATTYAGLLSKDGHEITGPVFESISLFSEGTAVARDRLTLRYGYIDKTGKWTLRPTFIAANPFSNGVATAKLSAGLLPIDVEGQYTYFSLIDSTGKELKKLPDFGIEPFDGNICVGSRAAHNLGGGVSDIVDKTGEVLFSGRFGCPTQKKGDRFPLFITTGQGSSGGCLGWPVGYQVTVSVTPDPKRSGHFLLMQENLNPPSPGGKLVEQAFGYYEAGQKAEEEKLAGDTCKIADAYDGFYLADRGGRRLCKNYSKIDRLNSTCFRVCDKSSRCGLIDATGSAKVKPKYQDIRVFAEGLAAVKMADHWGFVNTFGTVVVPAKYTEVGDFQDGVTFYRRK